MKNYLKLKIILCMLLIISSIVFKNKRLYAELNKYSLNDCIKIGLENNYQLKSTKEKLNSSVEDIKSAFGLFLPRIDISGSWTRLNVAPSINIGGNSFPIGQVDNYSGQISVTESLFTWGKIRNSYKVSKIYRDINLLGLEKMSLDLRADIKKTYFMILSAIEMEKSLQDSYNSLLKHRDQIKIMYKNGTASKFDLLRSEVQLSSLLPQIDKMKTGIETAKIGLKTLMGINDDLNINGEIKFIEFNTSLEELLKIGEERTDLKTLLKQLDLAGLRISITASGDKPSLLAIWNFQQQRPYQTQDEWGNAWNAVLALNYPIFDGLSTRKKVNSFKYQKLSLIEDINSFKAKIKMDIKTDYLALEVERSNLKLQDKIIEQSEEALKIARERYQNGLITNLEYLDSETALNQSKINKIQSLADYLIAIINLEKSCGKEFIKE